MALVLAKSLTNPWKNKLAPLDRDEQCTAQPIYQLADFTGRYWPITKILVLHKYYQYLLIKKISCKEHNAKERYLG